ncbi:Ribosomal RNA large subunit methyltransferase J [Carnimonas sp. R-84981]|uniref:23S rRNA (adenine(2030)-N(6))-methyltransferase RlmJ n=1 Tax=Carnimonas bestiolae TaxID=3402172 RepID=UPI003EDBD94A
MLAYQHAYHAGNIADVHKHLTLFALAQRLREKTSAITWVDTHAGRGIYPLDSAETQRGGEFLDGIQPLWQRRESFPQPSLVHSWLQQLAALNPDEHLHCYAGSPWWLARAMRSGDHLELYELHPGEHRHLQQFDQQLPVGARRHFGDGPTTLLKHLPVATPRLCVLIDPSYEVKSDYLAVAETLSRIAEKVRHAVVAIWYPLLAAQRHLELLEAVRESGVRKVLRSELIYADPDQTRGMYGSGMLVLNPPWQLDQQLSEAGEQLAALYAGRSTVEWWVAE